MSAAFLLSPSATNVLNLVQAAMDEAEGMGGTVDTADYVELMNSIIAKAEQRRRTAIQNETQELLDQLAKAGQRVGELESHRNDLLKALQTVLERLATTPMSDDELAKHCRAAFGETTDKSVQADSAQPIAIAFKWKIFALNHVLSDYSDKDGTLYDLMRETSDEDMTDLFDKHDVVVWDPYDDYPAYRIAEIIVALAESAQEAEA